MFGWFKDKRKHEAELYRKMWLDECVVSGRLHGALSEIADQETESANATVKRMAKLAREAMG